MTEVSDAVRPCRLPFDSATAPEMADCPPLALGASLRPHALDDANGEVSGDPQWWRDKVRWWRFLAKMEMTTPVAPLTK